MTQFTNKVFSVPSPGTDEYRVRHKEIFGEKPSDFCWACGKKQAWCDCEEVDLTEVAHDTGGESG